MRKIYKTFEDKPSLYHSESECADKNDIFQLIEMTIVSDVYCL